MSLFDDSNGMVEDFGRGGDHVDQGDVGGCVAVTIAPYPGRPEESVVAVYTGIAGA